MKKVEESIGCGLNGVFFGLGFTATILALASLTRFFSLNSNELNTFLSAYPSGSRPLFFRPNSVVSPNSHEENLTYSLNNRSLLYIQDT